MFDGSVRTTTLRTRRGRGGMVAAAAVVACLALAACGGSADGAAPAPDAASSAPPSANPSGAPSNRPAMDDATRQKVQECLQAAGIAVPTPTGTPRTPRQDGGGQGGGGQGGAGMFSSPESRAALEACGIKLPAPGERPSPTP